MQHVTMKYCLENGFFSTAEPKQNIHLAIYDLNAHSSVAVNASINYQLKSAIENYPEICDCVWLLQDTCALSSYQPCQQGPQKMCFGVCIHLLEPKDGRYNIAKFKMADLRWLPFKFWEVMVSLFQSMRERIFSCC